MTYNLSLFSCDHFSSVHWLSTILTKFYSYFIESFNVFEISENFARDPTFWKNILFERFETFAAKKLYKFRYKFFKKYINKFVYLSAGA